MDKFTFLIYYSPILWSGSGNYLWVVIRASVWLPQTKAHPNKLILLLGLSNELCNLFSWQQYFIWLGLSKEELSRILFQVEKYLGDGEPSLTATLDMAFICNLHSRLYNYLAFIIWRPKDFDSFAVMAGLIENRSECSWIIVTTQTVF